MRETETREKITHCISTVRSFKTLEYMYLVLSLVMYLYFILVFLFSFLVFPFLIFYFEFHFYFSFFLSLPLSISLPFSPPLSSHLSLSPQGIYEELQRYRKEFILAADQMCASRHVSKLNDVRMTS